MFVYIVFSYCYNYSWFYINCFFVISISFSDILYFPLYCYCNINFYYIKLLLYFIIYILNVNLVKYFDYHQNMDFDLLRTLLCVFIGFEKF